MRPNRPLRLGSRVGAFVLLVAGLAYLVLKAPYLALDAPDGLKALIVAPAAVLLAAAGFLAFHDARRRVGGATVALGFVALVWALLEPLPNGGWTFYTPYSSMRESLPPAFKGPSPILTGFALFLPFVGLAVFARRSVVGAGLIAAALWSTLCFAPSRWIDAASGMPHRYAYYYLPGSAPLSARPVDLLLPVVLGVAGWALSGRERREEGRGA